MYLMDKIKYLCNLCKQPFEEKESSFQVTCSNPQCGFQNLAYLAKIRYDQWYKGHSLVEDQKKLET